MSIPTDLTYYNAYLEKIQPDISNMTHIQHQVIQGFFYGICASILNDDILHDVDHVLEYAGADYIKYYRSHCISLHADIAHLVAIIPPIINSDIIDTQAHEFETWFKTHIPTPYNTVFSQLADGNDVEIHTNPPPKQRVDISRIRKTYKRRSRAHTPPPPLIKKPILI